MITPLVPPTKPPVYMQQSLSTCNVARRAAAGIVRWRRVYREEFRLPLWHPQEGRTFRFLQCETSLLV